MYGSNNLKQVGLAVQNYADSNAGRLPVSDGGYRSAYFVILPYLEHGNYHNEVESQRRPYNSDYTMTMYISPKDPTLLNADMKRGVASYVYNAQVFVSEVTNRSTPTINDTYTDGQSNTIVTTEHYALNCGNNQFLWIISASPRTIAIDGVSYTPRRSSFADTGDIVPDATNPPAVTFQVRPTITNCDPRIPQTPYASGLLVGLADGGVRLVNPAVTSRTFWAAVTPAGGEVLGSDW